MTDDEFQTCFEKPKKKPKRKRSPSPPKEAKGRGKGKNKAKKSRTDDDDEEDPTDGMEDPTPENSITEVKVTPNNAGKADMQPQKGPGTYMDMDEAEVGANEKDDGEEGKQTEVKGEDGDDQRHFELPLNPIALSHPLLKHIKYLIFTVLPEQPYF